MQRVEIIRALLTEPKLLILDEPTSVLTPQAVEKLFVVMHKLVSQGVSILYISHKLHEIRALCEVPNDAGATLLASLRADCHLQVHELSTPHKPIAVLGAALPAVGIGGVSGGGGEGDEIQGDGANGGERAREAVTM